VLPVAARGGRGAAAYRTLQESGQQVFRFDAVGRPPPQMAVRAAKVDLLGALEPSSHVAPELVADDAQFRLFEANLVGCGAHRIGLPTPLITLASLIPHDLAAVERTLQDLTDCRGGPRTGPADPAGRGRWDMFTIERVGDLFVTRAGDAHREDPPDRLGLVGIDHSSHVESAG